MFAVRAAQPSPHEALRHMGPYDTGGLELVLGFCVGIVERAEMVSKGLLGEEGAKGRL